MALKMLILTTMYILIVWSERGFRQLVDGVYTLSLIRKCLHVTSGVYSPLSECDLTGWFIAVLSPPQCSQDVSSAAVCEHCGYYSVSFIPCHPSFCVFCCCVIIIASCLLLSSHMYASPSVVCVYFPAAALRPFFLLFPLCVSTNCLGRIIFTHYM